MAALKRRKEGHTNAIFHQLIKTEESALDPPKEAADMPKGAGARVLLTT